MAANVSSDLIWQLTRTSLAPFYAYLIHYPKGNPRSRFAPRVPRLMLRLPQQAPRMLFWSSVTAAVVLSSPVTP